VEALEMGGLEGPKRTIYSMLGQAVTVFHSEMYQNNIFLFLKNYF
jgi:hypothetical protein